MLKKSSSNRILVHFTEIQYIKGIVSILPSRLMTESKQIFFYVYLLYLFP